MSLVTLSRLNKTLLSNYYLEYKIYSTAEGERPINTSVSFCAIGMEWKPDTSSILQVISCASRDGPRAKTFDQLYVDLHFIQLGQ